MQREPMGLSGNHGSGCESQTCSCPAHRRSSPRPRVPGAMPRTFNTPRRRLVSPPRGTPGTLAFRPFIHSDDTASPQRALTKSRQ